MRQRCIVELFTSLKKTTLIQRFNYTLVHNSTFQLHFGNLHLPDEDYQSVIETLDLFQTGEISTKHRCPIIYHASTMTFSKHISLRNSTVSSHKRMGSGDEAMLL